MYKVDYYLWLKYLPAQTKNNLKSKIYLLIAISTILRCVVAYCIGPGNDEVYYGIYSYNLEWNYFDHPPMVAWLIRLTTVNNFFNHVFFIRAGAIISAAITTWIIYITATKIYNEYAGFFAAFIYNCTIYGCIIAGTFILPDSPQMIIWSYSLYLLVLITSNDTSVKSQKKYILIFGITCGIGMLCKIHTSFLWFGFLLYILFYKKKLLAWPQIYIGGLISIAFFTPVILWNIKNNFITFTYHSNRVNVSGEPLNIKNTLLFMAGQFFYLSPIIFVLSVVATIAVIRNRIILSIGYKRILLLTSLPLIAITFLISVFKPVLPHWPGPAYTGLILLCGVFLAQKKYTNFKLPTVIKIAAAFIISLVFVCIGVINFYKGTMGKKDALKLGEGDFTLDMYGWKNLNKVFKEVIKNDINKGLINKDYNIVGNKWFPLAHIDYYIAKPLNINLLAIGEITDIHEYYWINSKKKGLRNGDDAYCIVPSNYYVDVKTLYKPYFKNISLIHTIEQKRSNKTCRYFYVYILRNYSR